MTIPDKIQFAEGSNHKFEYKNELISRKTYVDEVEDKKSSNTIA